MSDRPQWPYRRVADDLRQRIAGGELAGQLPSRFALAEQYGVVTKTVDRAIEVLREEGLIESEPGLGTFVRSGQAGGDSAGLT